MKRIAFILLLAPHLLLAQELIGKVVKIADGDTFTMLIGTTQIRVRLHGIDCPETGQDFSNVAKQFLSDYIAGNTVTVKQTDKDRYGRIIGMVFIDEVNVNEKILEAGLAWHYKYYDKNPAWAALENKARDEKKGLWSMADPVPPWEWRKKKKTANY